MLVRIFWVSEIVEPVSDVDIRLILGVAQIRNRRLDVTGMLAQSDGHFAQAIEGRREAVDTVMERIRSDPRHRDVRVILEEETARRRFSDWAMRLIRRDDMAAEMRKLHVEGAGSRKEVERVLACLLPA